MRKLLVALLLFGLGIGGAVIVAKPAGARTTVDGTLTGVVGPSPSISLKMNGATVTNLAPGTYELDVTDNSSSHNFDLCTGSSRCTNPGTSIFATSVSGTGTAAPVDLTLSDGTYRYQCDIHFNTMVGTFTVGTATTTTATTTTTQTATTSPTTTQSNTTTPTTTRTTTTTPTTTTTTGGGGGGGSPLTVHITSAKGTAHSVVVSVKSSKHGTATVQLFKGTKRLAKASHVVPGKVTLKPAHALKPGSYTVKVSVTAGGKHATATRTVKVS